MLQPTSSLIKGVFVWRKKKINSKIIHKDFYFYIQLWFKNFILFFLFLSPLSNTPYTRWKKFETINSYSKPKKGRRNVGTIDSNTRERRLTKGTKRCGNNFKMYKKNHCACK